VGELFQIPWGHHRYIIDKLRGYPEKALFFVRKTIENGWSRSVLLNFLDTDLYERQGKAISNFGQTLPSLQSDLAQEMTKDPYNFDFLTMTAGYKEKELKDALERNIVKFLLELGTGFAFIGREYRIMIGKTEKFIDMLFYNLKLRCYVVIEVKTDKFDSGNIGQLGTYVAAVNHILRSETDNPTIGILICKTKDNVLAQYALESSSQPIGISEYELSKLYPADFKGTLPTIEELEQEVGK
jgi:predicted nuclease of restriction endonuclease-like (RecB) superfamily